ncbi:ABC transporter substrate-binding protein [Pseudofrankia sp. BMG5.36]|uniref:ABC transporter substrate-binding protein n=1 Tax=Pseudofrankia sp. BMG5.36 TaxID=1834512 RepID=UPI0008D91DAA|nr:ABC transporter substrate-binding protein [Pseudofrankia sp. BMG5.36]OHV62169.1 branched-chain amino acid ABC transporter substrate-binding protein [Pseudofrankia sp. BMG5.36]
MRFRNGLLPVLATTLVMAAACGGSGSGGTSGAAGAASAGSSAGTTVALSRSTASSPATWKSIPVPGTLPCSDKAADPTRGITDTSIKIGGLGTLSNSGTSTYQETDLGAQARFARENAAGGVIGRKIDYIGMSDDGLSAQQNADAGKKLAENEKVFAVAPVATSIGAYADSLCANEVPAFGWAFNNGLCNRANTFGITGCLLPDKYNSIQVGPYVELLAGKADKSVVLLGVDNASARQGVADTKRSLERAGLKVVMTSNALQLGQPPADPSSLVRQIMTANNGKPPAMIYHVTDFVNVTALIQTMTAAGYQGIQISAVGYDPRLAGLKALDDTNTYLQWLPFQTTDNATVRQMTDDVTKYGKGAGLSITTAMGWISADMLIAGLKATGKDLTVDKFLSTLNSPNFHYGDGIFIGRNTWPENHFYGAPCATATKLKDGKYSLAVPLVCNDPYAD